MQLWQQQFRIKLWGPNRVLLSFLRQLLDNQRRIQFTCSFIHFYMLCDFIQYFLKECWNSMHQIFWIYWVGFHYAVLITGNLYIEQHLIMAFCQTFNIFHEFIIQRLLLQENKFHFLHLKRDLVVIFYIIQFEHLLINIFCTYFLSQIYNPFLSNNISTRIALIWPKFLNFMI